MFVWFFLIFFYKCFEIHIYFKPYLNIRRNTMFFCFCFFLINILKFIFIFEHLFPPTQIRFTRRKRQKKKTDTAGML